MGLYVWRVTSQPIGQPINERPTDRPTNAMPIKLKAKSLVRNTNGTKKNEQSDSYYYILYNVFDCAYRLRASRNHAKSKPIGELNMELALASYRAIWQAIGAMNHSPISSGSPDKGSALPLKKSAVEYYGKMDAEVIKAISSPVRITNQTAKRSLGKSV